MTRSLTISTIAVVFFLLSFSNIHAIEADSVGLKSWQEMMDSCNAYQQAQDFQTALKWALQALNEAGKSIETKRNETDSYNSLLTTLGKISLINKNNESALAYYNESLKLLKETHGDSSSDYLQALYDIASVYREYSLINEEEKLLKECLEIYKERRKDSLAEFADCYTSLGTFYKRRNNYIESEKNMLEAQKIYLNGINLNARVNAISYAGILNQFAVLYIDWNNNDGIEKMLKQAIEIYQKYLDDTLVVFSCNISIRNLASFNYNQKDYKKAEEIYREAANLCIERLELNSDSFVKNLFYIGNMKYLQGEYNEAEKSYQEVLYLMRQKNQINSYDYGLCLNNYISCLIELKNFDVAKQLIGINIEIMKNYSNIEPNSYTGTLKNRFIVIGNSFDHEATVSAQKEWLDFIIKSYGENSNEYWNTIDDMISLTITNGIYELAEELCRISLNHYQNESELNIDKYINVLRWQIDLYTNSGKYTKADSIYKTVIQYYKDNNLTGDTLSETLNNYALLLKKMGKYSESEEFYKEALEIRRTQTGENDKLFAIICDNTGNLYKELGRYSEAEKMLQKAISIFKILFGTNNRHYAISIVNLGMIYKSMGRYIEAINLLKEAIPLYKEFYGDKQPDYANVLDNLASLYDDISNLDEAESLYNESLKIRRVTPQKNYLNLSTTLNNLALIYQQKNKLDTALIYMMESNKLAKETLGENHPDYSLKIHNIGELYWASNEFEKSEENLKKSLQIKIKNLNNLFPTLSEMEKGQFYSTIKSSFEKFNSFAIQRLLTNPSITNDMYNFRLNTKAILLSSTKKVRQRILESNNQKLILLFNKWLAEKDYISRLSGLSKSELDSMGINLDSLEIIANSLEKELTQKSEFFAKEIEKKEITWKDIYKNLSEKEAAIEIVRFRKYDLKKDKNIQNFKFTDSIQYTFLIITKKTKQHPELVLLEDGKFIENYLIAIYRAEVKNQSRGINIHEQTNEVLNSLYQNIWSKIENSLEGINKLYISTDGVFNQFNLNTIYNPYKAKYLIEEYDITFVTNTKDIIELKNSNGSKKKPRETGIAELIGNPKFNMDSTTFNTKARGLRSVDTSAYRKSRDVFADNITILPLTRSNLSELPGTKIEIETISRTLQKNKWKVNISLGEDALEEKVKSLKSPNILHIATHGLFLKDINSGTINFFLVEPEKPTEKPLTRSMLLFAGAENSLSHKSNYSLDHEDGLLTAFEAMNLDLENTDLVVLSACETGLGEIVNGEGVFGLQRAFQVAGAKAIIMSLWSVSDKATQELMSLFYTGWMTGKSKKESFRDAQLQLKKKYPHFYYWGAFVMVGE